jgi:hypothetical protein
VKRREFITLVGAAWPFAARARQAVRTRNIGILNTLTAGDTNATARVAAFTGAVPR